MKLTMIKTSRTKRRNAPNDVSLVVVNLKVFQGDVNHRNKVAGRPGKFGERGRGYYICCGQDPTYRSHKFYTVMGLPLT